LVTVLLFLLLLLLPGLCWECCRGIHPCTCLFSALPTMLHPWQLLHFLLLLLLLLLLLIVLLLRRLPMPFQNID
jgi:hypothetical protein